MCRTKRALCAPARERGLHGQHPAIPILGSEARPAWWRDACNGVAVGCAPGGVRGARAAAEESWARKCASAGAAWAVACASREGDPRGSHGRRKAGAGVVGAPFVPPSVGSRGRGRRRRRVAPSRGQEGGRQAACRERGRGRRLGRKACQARHDACWDYQTDQACSNALAPARCDARVCAWGHMRARPRRRAANLNQLTGMERLVASASNNRGPHARAWHVCGPAARAAQSRGSVRPARVRTRYHARG